MATVISAKFGVAAGVSRKPNFWRIYNARGGPLSGIVAVNLVYEGGIWLDADCKSEVRGQLAEH